MNNAVDAAATSPGAAGVSIRLRVQGNDACVDVEDDGPGLPAPDSPVFGAFYTTKPASTGLGLAIVRRIAFDHSGSIRHVRERDRTIFTLRIPIVFGRHKDS